MYKPTALFAFFLILFSGFSAGAQQYKFKHENGDLLFQDLDCGGLCDAIESVTTGYKNATFSHVGIVQITSKGEVQVLEAIGDSVHLTPLNVFLNRQFDAAKKPKVIVGRLKEPYQNLIPVALKNGQKLRGKPYDPVFNIENDAYYCSELVYKIFREASNDPDFFQLYPMTYRDPLTKRTMKVWEDYFKKLNTRVPENEPGLNPGGISRSNKLKIYQPYGQPGTRKSRKAV
jgi:uncharacterized protein YycO